MNIKYILLALLLIISLACSQKPASDDISIKQIDSKDYSVIIRGNVANNNIFRVEIPLLFEYTDSNNQKKIRNIFYYYNADYGKYYLKNTMSSGWLSRITIYKINNNKLEYKGYGADDPIIISNDSSIGEVLGYTSHLLDTTKMTQKLLAPYLEQLKKRGVQGKDTLSVGSYQEFKAKYPELVKTLLEGDSIAFKVYNDQNKLDTVILLPIRY